MEGAGQRRVLVTGASGFLGRAVLSRLLADGDAVTAVVRPGGVLEAAPGLTCAPCDLTGDLSAILSRAEPLASVIHLAQAPGWHDFPRASGDIAAIAVSAACRLAEYACAVGAANFVYASSGGVYGPAQTPLVEGSPLKPSGELGFYLGAKTAAESLLAHFSPALGVQVLRPFFLYGPGQSAQFLMPRLMRSVAEGIPIRVAQGRGPRLNPLFVDDAARAVVAASRRRESLTVNLAGDERVLLADIVRIIGVLSGREPVFEIVDEAPADYLADNTLMRAELTSPSVDLKSGLALAGGPS